MPLKKRNNEIITEYLIASPIANHKPPVVLWTRCGRVHGVDMTSDVMMSKLKNNAR
jgi:hypothetical protein